ncbi:Aste57867_804 [Aphanomyces stellatus]|uniref:Aste57867_804 protein n=1 Tax=Aphanomyces stellatus TaxID=120398 RepID=A0A485K4J3_9STRA|nr:hypothetical protein As57867_000803 [Aphanomyces stellatus]VFT78028.1 Aste57867_804 [Aphanomyces stellatus]
MLRRRPLPQRLAITPNEATQLHQEAMASAMDVVYKSQPSGNHYTWHLRSSKDTDLSVYRASGPHIIPGSSLWMGVMDIVGSLDEVAELFESAQASTDGAKLLANRFGIPLVDACLLHAFPEQPVGAVATISAPATTPRRRPPAWSGVLWQAYKSPCMPLVVANRDACLLECHRGFELDGRRGYVASAKSMPNHLDSVYRPYVRMKNYGSGYVFLESAVGHLEVRYVVHVDFRGAPFHAIGDGLLHRRARMTDVHLMKHCRHVLALDRLLRENRLVRGGLLSAKLWQPHDTSTQCHLCHVPFKWPHAKSNCSKCGQVVCKSCNRKWTLVSSVGSPANYIRACVLCAFGGRQPQNKCQDDVAWLTSWSPLVRTATSDDFWDFDDPTTDQKAQHDPWRCDRSTRGIY